MAEVSAREARLEAALRESSADAHAYGLVSDHSSAKAQWGPTHVEACDDPGCVAALAALALPPDGAVTAEQLAAVGSMASIAIGKAMLGTTSWRDGLIEVAQALDDLIDAPPPAEPPPEVVRRRTRGRP